MTSKQQEQKSKQRKIRNSEYYDMVSTFDGLHADSKKGKIFNHLMEIIESEENIKLAYRTIKTNTGSDTAGVDKRTINDLAKLSEEEYVRLIRKQFSCYHPRPVKRVEIQSPMERPDLWEFRLSLTEWFSNASYRSWSRYVRPNSVIILTDSVLTDPLNTPSHSVCD